MKWLREQVTARLEAARATSRPAWRDWYTEPWYDGEFLNDGRTARSDLWGRAGAGGFTSQGALPTVMADHIALNDPQDVIARCEAELAILDGCDDQESWLEDAREGEPGDPALSLEWREGYVAGLRQVRELVASGYKHRPGYAEHWGEVNRPA